MSTFPVWYEMAQSVRNVKRCTLPYPMREVLLPPNYVRPLPLLPGLNDLPLITTTSSFAAFRSSLAREHDSVAVLCRVDLHRYWLRPAPRLARSS